MNAAAPSPSTPRRPLKETPIDEAAARAAFGRLRLRLVWQSWIILALGIGIFFMLPFARPVDLYYALNPDKQGMRLAGLAEPNLTNRAVLAWATTAITEMMTMGFGDMDIKLPKQKFRFTPEGWAAYEKAFVASQIGETFRRNQLVLTTVPSNTPVIIGQGLNEKGIYTWIVQMPVVMTYATNDNISQRQHGIITLTLVRVPPEQSSAGIAISSWVMGVP